MHAVLAHLPALLLFAFVSSITPGPNNIMLMASGANFGFRRTLPHFWGVDVGFCVLILSAGLGLAGVLARAPALLDALKLAGAAYLLWLAWRIARSALAVAATRAAAAVAFVKEFGRSAAQSSPAIAEPRPVAAVGWDLMRPAAERAEPAAPAEPPRDNVDAIAERIVAAHVPGRGLHIVGTSIGGDTASTERLIALGRVLAAKGRSLVDLGTTPLKLAALAAAEDGQGRVMELAGLSELLAGNSSFAEVIHRDCASRLHFIPTGLLDADFRDFDLILDALSETYDFIVLLTPAFPQSEIAKVMAPYADFVVLTAAVAPDRDMLGALKAEMLDAGARDVLVAEPRAGSTDVAVARVA